MAITTSIVSAPPIFADTSDVKAKPLIRSYARVIEVKEKDLPEVISTLRAWKRFMRYYAGHFPAPQDRKCISDFYYVLGYLQKDIGKLEETRYKILAAQDNTDTIQALSCYRIFIPEGCTVRRVNVTELLVAPWNLPLSKPPAFFSPLHGGGTMLMFAMFNVAVQNNLRMLDLSSTDSGKGFYEKMEMIPVSANTFAFLLDSEEAIKAIREVFRRIRPSLFS